MKKQKSQVSTGVSCNPGTVGNSSEVGALGPTLKDEVRFLEAYSKSLDVLEAAREIGMHHSTAKKLFKNPSIQREVKALEAVYRDSWKMNSQSAAGRHIQLMDKLESHLDAGDTKVAASLAKLSSDALKATGHFDSAEQSTAANIQVNISIGSGAPSNPVDVTVDGSLTPDPAADVVYDHDEILSNCSEEGELEDEIAN